MSLVELHVENSRADIVLNNPDLSNAIGLDGARQLHGAADRVRDLVVAGDVDVVVLRSVGKHFCVGGNLREFNESGDMAGLLQQVTDELHAAILILDELEVPVITAIQGSAAGAGVGLALVGDITLLAHSGVFRLAYTAVGLSPDGSSSFSLVSRLGTKLATALLLTNQAVRSADAASWGLVSQTVPDEELVAATDKVAASLVAGSRGAFTATKRLARAAATSTLTEQLRAEQESIVGLARTSVAQESIHAFLAR